MQIDSETSLYYRWPWWKRRWADVYAPVISRAVAAWWVLRVGWRKERRAFRRAHRLPLSFEYQTAYALQLQKVKPIWYTCAKEYPHEP